MKMSNAPFIIRQFECGDSTVTAQWQTPTLEPAGEYKCRWQINWPDRVRQSYSCGVDQVQALLLAMRTVHTELTESEFYKSGKLTYLEQYDLDLPPGFGMGPLYQPPKANGR